MYGNDVRQVQHSYRCSEAETLPSNSTNSISLLQHAKRAAYLADCYRANQHCASQKYRALLTGAKNGDMCNVVWTMLPPIVKSCQQVTKCGCKSECHGRLNVTALVSPALHCVVAGARLRRVFGNSKDNIISDRNSWTAVCYVFN